MPAGQEPGAEVAALFDRTQSLAAKPRTVNELPGGLTNRNYRVTTPDGTFVARISSGGSDLLGIDRDCEYRNTVTAAAAGAGAPVIEYRPQDGLLVIGYIDGRTFGNKDVAGNIPRIAQACRRLHGGGRFGNDFDMFAIQRRYLSVARSRGFRVPVGYDDLRPQFEAMEKALAVPKYGWTLWGAIQHAASPIDFDFWAWAMERFEGAARGLTAATFRTLLEDAQRDD